MRALLLLIAEEVDRQDRNHPGGYPFDRNGLRLGIAALQDEVQEVYEEWRKHKRDLGNGAESIRAELLQVMGVAFQIVEEIDAAVAGCPDHRPVLDDAHGWYCSACGSDAPPWKN